MNVGKSDLGMRVRIEPALTGIRRLLQRRKSAPVQADYWIQYESLKHGEWEDLYTAKQRRRLDVSEELLRRFRGRPLPEPDLAQLSEDLGRFLFPSDVAFNYGRLYEAASSFGGRFTLVMSASETAIQGLANVPWELSSEPTRAGKLIGLNPRATFCRQIDGPDLHVRVAQQGPLRLFYAISNQDPLLTRRLRHTSKCC